jgi:hypothetical protein
VIAQLSDDEDDEKLGDADEDAESEKLSQSVDNTSDKPDAPSCRLRSGIAASLCSCFTWSLLSFMLRAHLKFWCCILRSSEGEVPWAPHSEFCQALPHYGGERTEFTLNGSGYFPFTLNCNGACISCRLRQSHLTKLQGFSLERDMQRAT